MRKIATVFLISAGVLLGWFCLCMENAGAQDLRKVPDSPKVDPKDVEKADKYKGDLVSIPVYDLLRMYIERSGVAVIVADMKVLTTTTTNVLSSTKDGFTVKHEDWSSLIGDVLETHKFALVASEAPNALRLIAATGACNSARVVEETELDKVTSAEWVTCCYQPRRVESNAIAGLLRALVPLSGGNVGTSPGGLVVTARPAAMKRLLAVCRAVDQPPPAEFVVVEYPVPKGITGAEVAKVVTALFPANKDGVAAVTCAAIDKQSTVLVRGKATDQESVAALLKLLDK